MTATRSVVNGLLATAGIVFVAAVVASSGLGAAGLQQPAQPQAAAVAPPSSPQKAVFDKYCVVCHNPRLRSGGMALDLASLSNVGPESHVWEKVLRKLRTRAMPPGGRPRPDEATYDAVASWLETELDKAAAQNPQPGRTETVHRLNRVEYRNAIRDLLALEVDIESLLPPDNTFESGFDNNAAGLSITPAQLDQYLSAAKKISRLAVGIAPVSPVVSVYPVHINLMQEDRMGEDLPFVSRGGIGVRHYFPVDGEYTVKIELQENYNGYLRGMGTKQQLDVRLDGELIKRFSVGGEAPGRAGPLSYGGNIFGDSDWERYMLNADEGLAVKFPSKAGPHVLSVSFIGSPAEDEGVLQPRQFSFALAVNERYDGRAAVDNVAIGGPYTVVGPGDTPSRRAILRCEPVRGANEDACARRILSALARRAYRRPPTEPQMQTLFDFYKDGRRTGTFDDGVQLALARLLVDPAFLVRVERDPSNVAPGSNYQLTDLELASRLSFFLWSSIPDDQLLDAAIQGKLTKDPAELERQVRRLVADPRSSSLVDSFAAQWLNLRLLEGVLPDPHLFPDFDENLRQSLRRETELFIESTLREDRSVTQLLSANYTYLNERLARHYGIPGVYGGRFRRVTFDAKDPRGGLLGQGAVHAVTSYPTRTSVVLRGKWLLENVFGTVPPEPPPDVPSLPERGEGGEAHTLRELMESHRKSPVCAACHTQMDPLGFALESFDAIGRFRTSDAGQPLDVSGVLPSGVRFEGPAGLRAMLVSSQRALFIQTFTEKLLTYSLGRGLESYDQPTVRQIIRNSASSDYRWSSIILGIVKSTPFRMRRSLPAETAANVRVH
jgi:mono/diheme cytochrome c family protein